MRPVLIPNEPSNFNYTPKNGREALAKVIGNFCSYCEIHSNERNIELEHIISQKGGENCHADKWYNFVLSCGGCNKAKKRKEFDITRHNLKTFILPHIDDTYGMIDYDVTTKLPKPNESLDENDKKRVIKTLEMLKFIPSKETEEFEDAKDFGDIATDRCDAFKFAERKKEKYIKAKQKNNDEECKDIICDIVTFAKKDNWSVLLRVFNNIEDVREEILHCIDGTDLKYFEDLSQQSREEYNKYKYYRYYLQITITELQQELLDSTKKNEELTEVIGIRNEIEQMQTLTQTQKNELLVYVETIQDILK